MLIESSTPIGVFTNQFTCPLASSCHFGLSSFTHSRLPSSFFVTLSIPMQIPIITFFHSLLPTYLRPFLPGPTSKTSLGWQQIQYHSSAYSKIGSAAKRGKRKRRLCFAGKLQRNNIRNQLCERGTKSTRRERGRRESTDCSSIN